MPNHNATKLQSRRHPGPRHQRDRISDSGSAMIKLKIDGNDVEVRQGTTIWDAARSLGIDIPTLCHDPRMTPVGVCRKMYGASGIRARLGPFEEPYA